MRVAIVYDFFPHYREGVLRALARGKDAYVFVGDRRATVASIKVMEFACDTDFIEAPCRSLLGPLFYQRGLIRLALRPDIDVIIYLGCMYFVSTWVSAAIARFRGKRVLLWTHGWLRPDTGIKGLLRRCFYRLGNGLLLYGNYAKSIGIGFGFDPSRMHVIYNSLDYDEQRRRRDEVSPALLGETRRSLFGDSDIPMVVCTARVTRECRFDVLLRAQDLLFRRGYRINVLIVGDGPEVTALKSEVRKRGLNCVFFGPCYDERTLARLIMSASVTVSPGKVGLTAIHSLAYGTPVISHDDVRNQGPEVEAIIPGRTGDLFRAGNAEDLARVIKKWTSAGAVPAEVRLECQRLIERFYNPSFQAAAISRAVKGKPADDLFWIRESERC